MYRHAVLMRTYWFISYLLSSDFVGGRNFRPHPIPVAFVDGGQYFRADHDRELSDNFSVFLDREKLDYGISLFVSDNDGSFES